MRTERFSFGAVESRFQGRLGLVSSRSTVARAQKEDKEDLELGKAVNKSTGKVSRNQPLIEKFVMW